MLTDFSTRLFFVLTFPCLDDSILIVVVCFHQSPDWEIRPNYKVVGFQHRAGIDKVLYLYHLSIKT